MPPGKSTDLGQDPLVLESSGVRAVTVHSLTFLDDDRCQVDGEGTGHRRHQG